MGSVKQSRAPLFDQGFSQSDLDEVSDNPKWTAEELKRAKPFAEVFPELARKFAEHKAASEQVALDRRVVEKFQSQGDDWQERINDVLRKAVGL